MAYLFVIAAAFFSFGIVFANFAKNELAQEHAEEQHFLEGSSTKPPVYF